MVWISTISFENATGRLRQIYQRIRGPAGQIDNILMAHSHRPQTLEGHMALYKSVLHSAENQLPPWFLETIGVQVSLINGCQYCVVHHQAGLRRHLSDDERAARIVASVLEPTGPEAAELFDNREIALLTYAAKLTRQPAQINEQTILGMRVVGITDGEILEVNQVVAYFAYANRTVLGLGVTTDGEALGHSPDGKGDSEDWKHR